MAVGNFLGVRSEAQQREELRREEHREILAIPEGEREEIRQIYAAKGFDGDLLEQIVEVITASPDRWVDTMLVEEHGVELEGPVPLRAGLSTFVAFVLVGFVPILPFVAEALGAGDMHAWSLSMVLTAIAFFAVGAVKGAVVNRRVWQDGLETLALGGAAALVAFGVGWALRGIAGTA
jgi:VIT1/CCC1 family predicted Fe2+/Mn2+ transporter